MDIKLDIYRERCLLLAESMYLKFDLHALSVEKWVSGLDDILYDRRDWLNYRNMAGLYHTFNTPMVAISLDTLEEISFDKDTLKDHPTTLNVYREFGKHYKALVSKYPDNDILIKGILYNKSIDDIIAMDDFHIVGYNTNLVDPQEYDLISTLNKYLSKQGVAAGCPNYSKDENHYATAILSFVTTSLPVMIKRIRNINSKSYNAHSFYIWSHINSVINLDKYKDYLNYNDVMFLFKNISRLKNGLASKSVFNEIVSSIIRPKRIRVYNLRSDILLDTIDLESDVADAEWYLDEVGGTEIKRIPVEDIVSEHVERSSYKTVDPFKDISRNVLYDFNSNLYPEITLIDDNDSEGLLRRMLVDVDYAFLFSGTGVLSGYFDITMPDTGDVMTLLHKDILSMYTRITQLRVGNLTDVIPPHVTVELYNHRPLDIIKLRKCGLTDDVIESILSIVKGFPVVHNDVRLTWSYVKHFNDSRNVVMALLDKSYTPENALCIEDAYSEIFKSHTINVHGDNPTWEDWSKRTGVYLDDKPVDVLDVLASSILKYVIGITEVDSTRLISMMSDMLSKFVSYKTNITREVSPISSIRLGLRPTWATQPINVSDMNGYIHGHVTIVSNKRDVDIVPVDTNSTPVSYERGKVINDTNVLSTTSTIIPELTTLTSVLTSRPNIITAKINGVVTYV